MSPFKPFYTPDEIIDQIKRLMAELGPDAFKIDGKVILYSGPRHVIAVALGYLISNHKRVLEQVKSGKDGIIDITEIGSFLGEFDETASGEYLNIYEYYHHHFGPFDARTKEYPDKVMRFASEAFIEAISGDVLTAVCGAGLDKIFFQVELPGLIRNKNITSVNGLPIEAIREFYIINPYEAFKLVCLSELYETFQTAATNATSRPIKAWQEFFDRTAFYSEEQKDPKGRPAPLTKYQELKKQELITKYGLGHLYDKVPADWGGPVVTRTTASPSAHYRPVRSTTRHGGSLLLHSSH